MTTLSKIRKVMSVISFALLSGFVFVIISPMVPLLWTVAEQIVPDSIDHQYSSIAASFVVLVFGDIALFLFSFRLERKQIPKRYLRHS